MSISVYRVASALVPLMLGACATAPTYERPSMDLSSHYVGRTPVAVAGQPEVAANDLTRWWERFDDPLLSSLVMRAVAQNLDLVQAEARVAQARAAFRYAKADMLPSVQASGDAGIQYQSTETPLGQIASSFPGYDRTSESYQAGVGASWELDVFGGKDAARDAARAEWQASQAASIAARLAIIAETADTYIRLRSLQQQLTVLRAQIDRQARLVNLIGLQFQRGIAAELQLRQAEGALQQIRASEPLLVDQMAQAGFALDVLLGLQPGSLRAELAAPGAIPAPPELSTADGPSALLRRRPDIIAAERRLAASNARIGVAVAEYYPKFSLSGLLGLAAGSPGALFGGSAVQGGGFLGLRWRLFDFGRIDADVARAKGANAEALAGYRQTVLRATQDVENALSQLAQAEARQAALQKGEASLVRAQQSSTTAYKAGAVSLIEVLDADRRVLETRDALVQARAAESRAAVGVFRSLGGGWEGSQN